MGPPGMGDGASSGGTLLIDMEHVHFDTTYAEPAALAAMLVELGSALHDRALAVCFAEFRAVESLNGDSKAVEREGSKVDAFLQKHGLDHRGGGSRPGSSVIAEYLRAFRPLHLHRLHQAGVCFEPEDNALFCCS